MSDSCVVDLHPTIGTLEIGSFISVFLFGVVTVQTHMYYRRFPEDRRILKALVAFVWSLEVGHTICICHTIYDTTISLYGRPQDLTKFDSIYYAIILGALVTTSVQVFFALRLWRVMSTCLVGLFCCALSCARCIGSIAAAVLALKEVSLREFGQRWDSLITTLLVVGAFVDVVIAVTMCYFLKQQREIALSRIARLIDSLIAWTIQTGLITSIAAIAMVICFQTMPEKLTWLAIYSFLAKLYSNSLLAALNARFELRNAMTRCHEIAAPMDTAADSCITNRPRFQEISIEMTQEQEISSGDSTAARLYAEEMYGRYPDRPRPIKMKVGLAV